jgi:hypothetical protein
LAFILKMFFTGLLVIWCIICKKTFFSKSIQNALLNSDFGLVVIEMEIHFVTTRLLKVARRLRTSILNQCYYIEIRSFFFFFFFFFEES